MFSLNHVTELIKKINNNEPGLKGTNKIADMMGDDEWMCISGLDNYGGHLSYVPNKSIKEMKKMASTMDNCVAFNS